jgi:hypothetical protein
MKEFLNQQLPSVEFYSGRPSPPRPHRLMPSLVTEWNSVDTQISDFVNFQSAKHRLIRDSILFTVPTMATMASLRGHMENTIIIIGRNLLGEKSGFSVSLEQVVCSSILGRDALGDLGDAGKKAVLLAEGARERIDVVSKLGSNSIFVVEVKRPSLTGAQVILQSALFSSFTVTFTTWT